MTLAEERELKVVNDGFAFITGDCHSKNQHWHAKYPWLKVSLPNNRGTVEATFLRTEKHLAKEPKWKAAYATQGHDMVTTLHLTSENDLGCLRAIAAYVEHILKAGGFQLKPWFKPCSLDKVGGRSLMTSQTTEQEPKREPWSSQIKRVKTTTRHLAFATLLGKTGFMS